MIPDDYIMHNWDGTRLRKCYPKSCEYCNETFLVPKHRYDKQKYCSQLCAGELRKIQIDVLCDYCSCSFTRSPSKIKNSRSGLTFCSRECKEALTTELGKTFTGLVAASSIADKAKKERGRVCEKCGYDERPEIIVVHHIDQDRSNNDFDNLIVLCPNCHAIEHLVDTGEGLVLRFRGDK